MTNEMIGLMAGLRVVMGNADYHPSLNLARRLVTGGASNAVRSRTCHVNSCTTFGRFLRTPRLATTRAAAS